MADDVSLWRLLLFVLAIAGFLALSGTYGLRLQLRRHHLASEGLMWAAGALANAVALALLSFVMWLLAGGGNMSLFLTFALATFLLAGVAELLWLMFGEANAPWAARTVWMRVEFRTRFSALSAWLTRAHTGVLIVYVVWVSVRYLGGAHVNDPNWERWLLQLSVVMLFGAPWLLLSLPAYLYAITSPNLLEGTRSRFFVTQLAGSVAVLILISVFFWAALPNASSVDFGLFILPKTGLYLVGGYVVGVLVVPYLIGHARSKGQIESLQLELDEITQPLIASVDALRIERAEEALNDSEEVISRSLRVMDNKPGYRLLSEVSLPGGSYDPALIEAAVESLRRDPRYLHVLRLSALQQHITDCREVMAQQTEEKAKREVLGRFKNLVAADVVTQPSRNAWALVAITGAFSGIFTPVVKDVYQQVAVALGL